MTNDQRIFKELHSRLDKMDDDYQRPDYPQKQPFENYGLTVSKADLISKAQFLKSNDGENPEYDRALCELIADVTLTEDEFLCDGARRIGKELEIDPYGY